MTEREQEFRMLLSLRRHEAERVLERVREALEEDLRENAEMFDITRTDFSQNLHPNNTMRALEKELAERDEPFLCLLLALRGAGMEESLGLCERSTYAQRVSRAAFEYTERIASGGSAQYLAHEFTEGKAHNTARWLAIGLGLEE